MRRNNTNAHLIAAGGLAVILFALYLHWRYERDIELVVLGIGGFLLWYGGYLANRRAALEGGAFIVDSLVKLLPFRWSSAKPGGRRAEDRSDVPTVVLPLSAPSHEPPAVVTWKDGDDEGII